MAEPNIRQMFEAGVHFGHQTRFWNPDMAPYIYGERNKIHIIDLDTALPMFKSALDYLKTVAASGGKILFVGTKRAARHAIEQHARRCGMPYVNHRWLGGMLTNFKTVRVSVKRYVEMKEDMEQGGAARLSKKQALRRNNEIQKLSRNLEGIKEMVRLPEAIFIIDVRHEKIAVKEAAKLGVPVVAIVDTNNSFNGVDYVVPGNDDAIRSVNLYVSSASDAILAGIAEREEMLVRGKEQKGVQGVIKVQPKDGSGKEAPKERVTIRKTGAAKDKKDGEEAQPKPKVRMRGLTNKLKDIAKRKKESEDKANAGTKDSPEIGGGTTGGGADDGNSGVS